MRGWLGPFLIALVILTMLIVSQSTIYPPSPIEVSPLQSNLSRGLLEDAECVDHGQRHALFRTADLEVHLRTAKKKKLIFDSFSTSFFGAQKVEIYIRPRSVHCSLSYYPQVRVRTLGTNVNKCHNCELTMSNLIPLICIVSTLYILTVKPNTAISKAVDAFITRIFFD